MWSVIALSIPAVISLALLPLARAPFERVPAGLRTLLFLAFDVGLVSKYFSICAACLALMGILWKGVSTGMKAALLSIAGLSWLAAIHVSNVLTSCFGGARL
jgi:hypothetical protein